MKSIKGKFIDPAIATDVELAAAIAGVQEQMSTLTVPFSFSDLPLPTGAATDASLQASNLILADIDSKLSGTIKVDGSAVTQPISGTVAISNFPTEPTTVAVNNFPTSIQVSNLPATQTILGSVTITNFPADPTSIQVSNFPATQPISGTVAISNFPPEPTSIAVNNFPTTQEISGSVTATISGTPSVSISNASIPVTGTFYQTTQPVSVASIPTHGVTQSGTWTMGVSNFPATQAVSGTVAVSNQPTSIQVSNFPATQPISGSVSVSNFPASQAVTGTFWQATQPVSGTFFQAIQPVTLVDGQKATYSAVITGLVTATTPTDVFTISGSATKTIKITRLGFTGLQTTSALRDIVLLKRSTANTGGTSTLPTIVPFDSNNAAATAVVTAYTVNPTTLGTLVGNIRSYKYPLDANPTGTSAVPSTPVEWTFGDKGGQAITLRGAAQLFCVNLNSVTSTGDSLDIFVEWTEE